MFRRVLLVIVLLAGTALVFRFTIVQMRASIGYGIRAEFTTLPADDHEFEQWFASQPGVAKSFVKRNGNSVGVIWVQVQTVSSRMPPVPDYRAAFERFRYRGMVSFDPNWDG